MIITTLATFKRYPDRCYAVVSLDGKRRGPCGPSKRFAERRWLKGGFIADAATDKRS